MIENFFMAIIRPSVTKAYSKKKASFKTVDNTLGAMALKRLIVRPRRGKYSLSPKQLQEF